MEAVQQQVLDIIREVSPHENLEPRPEHHLLVDLGVDSPLAIELLMRLQTEVGLKVTEEEAGLVETVADLLSLASRKLAPGC